MSAPLGIPCWRCHRMQPPLPRGVRTCVYCSAALPVTRWRADSPIVGLPGRIARPPRRDTYLGPPSYGLHPPRWGYPPVVWQAGELAAPDTSRDIGLPLLRAGLVLSLVTAATALAAAGGEIWRYVLMLRGRTEVLSGAVVAASDRLVTITGPATVVIAAVTAVVVGTVLVRLHAGAARRVGLAPSRPPAAVLARLVVPGWNVYGLGQVASEIDGLLSGEPAGGFAAPRLSRLVLTWWVIWGINAVLVLITLGRAFGRSDQAVADTVELHGLIDLIGASMAVLTALVLQRFRRLLRGSGSGVPAGWLVQPPRPTRGQPAMVKTAPGNAEVGPEASQATVSASVAGDQPDEAAGPEPTTMTLIP